MIPGFGLVLVPGKLLPWPPQRVRIPLATKTENLQDVDHVLEAIEETEPDTPDHEVPDPVEPGLDPADFLAPEEVIFPETAGALPQGMMSLLRAGIAQMSTMEKVREFPEFFLRLAQHTGLRLVLLKRWTSGLQVFMEENIQLPAEAKKKRRDGRAPIPSTDTDIFQVLTEDATIYTGPVPVKHFPLDLTLMLGRGSRDRQIIILPLPSQNHWNTFLYLDADQATLKPLAVAEVLAHFALARMCLINKGGRISQGKVKGILKSELQRRKVSDSDRDLMGAVPPSSQSVTSSGTNWSEAETHGEGDHGNPAAYSPEGGRPDTPSDVEDGSGSLTPEAILHHSGELPALPKAACHIMAVIEDPGTTATKLEHALAMDQALTAKVLRIANSPFYGAVREITTVSEAIVRLGFVAIRNWTLVTAARSVFLTPGAGLLYQKIWRQSVMSAMAGQLVAQAVGRSNPDSVFLGGLMQNIGQLVLARSNPQLFQDILTDSAERGLPYHIVERGRLGFDHGELGALLIKEWNLSQELEDAVRWHHRINDQDAKSQRIAAMISLGEEIAWCNSGQEDIPADGDQEASEADSAQGVPLSEAAEFLEITAEAMAELNARAAELKIDPHFFS
jgi:HD-like signal output (HDOD) protein